MIVWFQIVCSLVVYRSDALANFVDLESGALRASMEASALIAEREKWEQEKENMRHDREMWGKVPEDPVPSGAYWYAVGPSDECLAYGKREYNGMLQSIPKSWSAVDACMNTPVSIEVHWSQPAVRIRRPHRCASVDGSLYGYWIVDWYQHDCQSKLKDIHDTVGQRYFSASTPLKFLRDVQTIGPVSLESRPRS